MSIEKNFHRYLFELVKSNAMNNTVAKTIALNYNRLNRSSKEKLFESLMPAYQSFSETAFSSISFEESAIAESTTENKDFRLKAVRIANVRGIPKLDSPYKFGIDLCEGSQIQNGVFLGPNGTGKSSLFNAIEFIYAHEVAEKKLRVANPEALKEKDFIEYLEHFNTSPECEIQTPSGNFSIREKIFKTEEELKTIYPDTHFISDYDIYKKGQLAYTGDNNDTSSFHFLIASSLGLQDYLDFTALLKSLSSYRRSKESSEKNKHLASKKTLEDGIKKNREEIEAKSQRIEELRKTSSAVVQNESQERLISVIEDIKQTNFAFRFNREEYRGIFENFENDRDKYLGLSVNQTLQTEAQFLSLGLELINHSENCPFCESSTLSATEIKRKIEDRLKNIKDFDVSAKDLEESVRNIFTAIKDVATDIEIVEKVFKSEVSKIERIAELQNITDEERKFAELLNEQLSKLSHFIDQAEKQSSLTDTLIKRSEVITELIKDVESTLLIEIPATPEAIHNFSLRRKQKIEEIELSYARGAELILPTQQIAILESEVQSLKNSITTSEQEINRLDKEIEQLAKTIETINEIKQHAGEFAQILNTAVNNLVSISFEPIKETIESILSDYLKEEDVELQIRLDEKPVDNDPESSVTTIIAEVQKMNKETGIPESFSPSKYFNTFRYRLFSTMVSISIIIAARKNSGINLPLVLDDVFYASDYNSKITFKDFIIKVLNSFKKFNGELPLQFILFTHDELIFDSALDAISEFGLGEESSIESHTDDIEWKTSIQDRTIFARLFSANDIDSNTAQSPLGNYWDLSYKIPTRVDQLIKSDQDGRSINTNS